MAKTVKSNLRRLLFTMINKFSEVKSKMEEKLTEKQRQLNTISSLIETSITSETKLKIKEIVENIKTLEQQEVSSGETGYLETISSMTEISVSTLRRIKKEGSLNQGKFNTPGKKRPHPKKISLDSFDISAIRNKINEYYCVKKQVPTLRSLHKDLNEAIGFSGGREKEEEFVASHPADIFKNCINKLPLRWQ